MQTYTISNEAVAKVAATISRMAQTHKYRSFQDCERAQEALCFAWQYLTKTGKDDDDAIAEAAAVGTLKVRKRNSFSTGKRSTKHNLGTTNCGEIHDDVIAQPEPISAAGFTMEQLGRSEKLTDKLVKTLDALLKSWGNDTEAAELLGSGRTTVWRHRQTLAAIIDELRGENGIDAIDETRKAKAEAKLAPRYFTIGDMLIGALRGMIHKHSRTAQPIRLHGAHVATISPTDTETARLVRPGSAPSAKAKTTTHTKQERISRAAYRAARRAIAHAVATAQPSTTIETTTTSNYTRPTLADFNKAVARRRFNAYAKRS